MPRRSNTFSGQLFISDDFKLTRTPQTYYAARNMSLSEIIVKQAGVKRKTNPAAGTSKKRTPLPTIAQDTEDVFAQRVELSES